jgi:hypothetical protein
MPSLSPGLSGVAGEYFVCAELSQRGIIATLTLKNTEGIDVLASKPGSGKAISIQVKTQQSAKAHWVLKERDESHHAEGFFYVLVRLCGAGHRPNFHIVPSVVMAERIANSHKAWIAGTKRNGGARKDTPMRSFNDPSGEYLEKWELLG